MRQKVHDMGIKILEKVKPLITMHKNIVKQKINIVKIKNTDNNQIIKKVFIFIIVGLLLISLKSCNFESTSNKQHHKPRVFLALAMPHLRAKEKPVQLPIAEIRQRAFLDTIAYAEGSKWDICYGGYKANYNSKSYPCPRRRLNGITSSAFGAFQILDTTWRANADKECMHNFSKICQIKIANKLLKSGGISKLIQSGNITPAINKSSRIWASMPTSRGKSAYGQPSHKLSKLLSYYNKKVNLYIAKQGGLNNA